MSNRYQTFGPYVTSSVAGSGGTLQVSPSVGPSSLNIVKMTVTQDISGGTLNFRVYKNSSFASGTRLARVENKALPLYNPVDVTTAPPAAANEGCPIPYDDDNETGCLHLEFVNNDTAAHVYTVTIEYEEVPVFTAAGLAGFGRMASSLITQQITIPNNTFLGNVNAAGNATIPVIGLNSSNVISIAPNGQAALVGGALTVTGLLTAAGGFDISGYTPNSMAYFGASGALDDTAAAINGQILIGGTGVAPALGLIAPTANQTTVTNTSNGIQVGTVQNIGTGNSPTFVALTLSGSQITSGAGVLSLPTTTDTLVGRITTDTLTNKTLTAPTINAGALSGTFSGNHTISGQATFSNGTAPIISSLIGPSSAQQHTIPAVASDTIALLAAAQTFTNKTLTNPTINAAALSGTLSGSPTFSGALTLNSALTYGGVTLSNSVTGTGSMVLSASPTFTGTVVAPIINAPSTLALEIGSTAIATASASSFSLTQPLNITGNFGSYVGSIGISYINSAGGAYTELSSIAAAPAAFNWYHDGVEVYAAYIDGTTYDANNQDLKFRSGSTDRVRFTYGGSVQIGYGAASVDTVTLLQVNGNIKAASLITAGNGLTVTTGTLLMGTGQAINATTQLNLQIGAATQAYTSSTYPWAVQTNNSGWGAVVIGRSTGDLGQINFLKSDASTSLGNIIADTALAGLGFTGPNGNVVFQVANNAATFNYGVTGTTLNLSGTLSIGTNPANSGVLRIPNGLSIISRNAANTSDINIAYVDSSNHVNIDPSGFGAIAGGSFSAGTNPAQSGILRIPNASSLISRNGANSSDINIVFVDSSNHINIDTSAWGTIFGGQIQGPVGSASVPTYSFTGHTSSGNHSDSSGNWYTTVGGVDLLTVANTGIVLGVKTFGVTGNVSAPSFADINATNYGIYFPGDAAVAIASGGSQVGVFNSLGLAVTGATYLSGNISRSAWGTAAGVFGTSANTLTDTSSTGTVSTVVASSFGQPTFAATNTSVTYTNGATIYIAGAPANGTNVTITNPWSLYVAGGNTFLGASLKVTGQTFIGTGSASSPTLTDFNAGNYGIYFPSDNSVAVTTNGTQAVRWDASQNQINTGTIQATSIGAGVGPSNAPLQVLGTSTSAAEVFWATDSGNRYRTNTQIGSLGLQITAYDQTGTVYLPLELNILQLLFNQTTNTASVPSIANANASNYGLYFPSNTAVAISTNGIQAVKWDSSQNQTNAGGIGIGASPGSGINVLIAAANSGGTAPTFSTQYSRGTLASPTIVVNGDTVADFDSSVYNGTGYGSGAAIQYQVDGVPTSGQRVPTRIAFYTTPLNGIQTQALSISASQTLTMAGALISTLSSGIVLRSTSATTGSMYLDFQNSSGQLLAGVESSAGGAIFTGSAANAVVIGNGSNGPVQIFTNNTKALTLDTSQNATFAGEIISSLTSGTFLNAASATTGDSAITVSNTSGGFKLAVLNSSGASGAFSGTAYATAFGSFTNTPVQFYSNATLAATISTAQAWTFAGAVIVPANVVSGITSTLPATLTTYLGSGGANYTSVTNSSTRLNGGLVGASNDSGPSTLALLKTRDTGGSATTTVVSGDVLGRIWAVGADGTNYVNSARIDFATTGTIATGRVPSTINFYTGTDAATTVVTLAGTIGADQSWTFKGALTVPGGTSPLMTSSTAWTTGAGSSAGTLTNAPSIGNPTKWIPINDNGTTRYIPAW